VPLITQILEDKNIARTLRVEGDVLVLEDLRDLRDRLVCGVMDARLLVLGDEVEADRALARAEDDVRDVAVLRVPNELGVRNLLLALPVRDQRLARQVDEQDDDEE